jgi:hypothetical protein
LYIGAVAVLPTYAKVVVLIERSSSLLVRLLEESKSGKQALREVRMKHMFIWRADERIAVWGDGVWGAVHVFCSVSVTPLVLISELTDGWV